MFSSTCALQKHIAKSNLFAIGNRNIPSANSSAYIGYARVSTNDQDTQALTFAAKILNSYVIYVAFPSDQWW